MNQMPPRVTDLRVGEWSDVTETVVADSLLHTGDEMNDELSGTCAALQALRRNDAALTKQRVMNENHRRAYVATLLGYSAGQAEKVRKEYMQQADSLIKQLVADPTVEHQAAFFVRSSEHGIASLLRAEDVNAKQMRVEARKLPVAEWAALPEQRGFGELSLARVIGETGDLRLYANPAKVWRRLGLAPWTFQKGGEPVTRMGSTWRAKGGLPADEWSAFGYSPRRRSVMYVVGDTLMKGNRTGPYKARYDEAKVAKVDTGWPPIHAHKHALLVMTKLLVKNLWKAWNPGLDRGEWSELMAAEAVA